MGNVTLAAGKSGKGSVHVGDQPISLHLLGTKYQKKGLFFVHVCFYVLHYKQHNGSPACTPEGKDYTQVSNEYW